uniref:Pentatricopeptide repeat-containing protein n=1 Tax=Quercus lobata TaxID=97700 RepID=A0A7N2MQX9_QUELO
MAGFIGRQGRVREALCLFQEMESQFRCKPDNLVDNNMLYVLCKKERFETAHDVFGEIGRAGLVPTRSAENFLIGELCSLSAKGVVEKVVKDAHRPFTILVPNVGANSGAVQPADAVFWAVHEMGLLPRNLDDAKRVFEIMNKKRCLPDNFTYLALILAHGEARKWEDAYGEARNWEDAY